MHVCNMHFLIILSPICSDPRPNRHQGNLKGYYEARGGGVRNFLVCYHDDDRDSEQTMLVNE